MCTAIMCGCTKQRLLQTKAIVLAAEPIWQQSAKGNPSIVLVPGWGQLTILL